MLDEFVTWTVNSVNERNRGNNFSMLDECVTWTANSVNEGNRGNNI